MESKNININKTDNNLMIISIISYYARQIFDGTKLYEFRKSPIPQHYLNKPIFVYSAKTDKAIIGSFKVKQILNGNVAEIMRITGYDTRKDGYEIINYYGKNNNCYALELYDIKKFQKPFTLKEMRSIDPNFSLPQYYASVKPSSPVYNKLKKLSN